MAQEIGLNEQAATDVEVVVPVGSDEDLADLIERLPTIDAGRIVVAVDDDSPTLVTAAEFSRVLAAVRDSGRTVALASSDPLRRELARMLGWPVTSRSIAPPPAADVPKLPDDVEARRLDPEDGRNERADATASVEVPRTRDTTADIATYRPAMIPTVIGRREGGGSGQTSGAEQPPSVDRAPGVAASAGRRITLPSQRASMRALAIGAPVAVLLVLAGILYYVLPSAVVTVTPAERVITSRLTYGLAGSGGTYDLTIDPTSVAHTVVFDRTIPTTGERFEADGTASGVLQLTNPSTAAVVVPAGTSFAGKGNVTYVSQQDVTVPAADPFGSQAFGSATVTIGASAPGPDGNAAIGAVAGQLPNGVFYTNRAAIEGGTVRRIAVVSEADIAALTEAANSDLAGRVDQEFAAALDPRLRVVPGSEQKGEPALQFSAPALADATEVSVHGTLEMRAQTFDPGALHQQARDEAGRRLADQAGPEVTIVGESVKIGDPEPLNDAQTAFAIPADATVRSILSDEERAALVDAIAGKSIGDAEQALAGNPDLAGAAITVSPSWLPDRLPELPSRINIVMSGEQ